MVPSTPAQGGTRGVRSSSTFAHGIDVFLADWFGPKSRVRCTRRGKRPILRRAEAHRKRAVKRRKHVGY
eukprot:1971598-Pleurochrysis_carterae.AAC.1